MATPLAASRIPALLEAEGVANIVEMSGWASHNRNSKGAWGPVHGVMIHGTGDASTVALSRQRDYVHNILYAGHGGLPGPLCQIGIGTDGTVYLVGWGRANHAGSINQAILDKVIAGTLSLDQTETPGSDQTDGNSRLYGIEIIQPGSNEITDSQYNAAVKVCAALCRAHGWTGRDVVAHKEATRRKPNDPPKTNMGFFRRDVIARVAGPATPKKTEGPVADIGGRIGQRWAELGGPKSILGNPTGDEVKTDTGAYRPFANGVMIWSFETDARPNYGKIRKAYERHGFEHGHLGHPIDDPYPTKDGGQGQTYQHGRILGSARDEAFAVYGAIEGHWAAQGYEHGPLGYPTSDEYAIAGGRGQRFEGGTVWFSHKHGTHTVWGSILEKYARQGWENGALGYPTAPERSEPTRWVQSFEHGEIFVAKPVKPAITKAIAKVTTPVPGSWISARFGQKPKNNTYWQAKGFHTGRDYAASEGAPVVAVVDGTLTVRDDAVLGCISILHGDNGRKYWYCHLQRGSRDPWRGERVKAGQQIGRVGQTGTGASGPHLHLEDSTSASTWGVGLRDPKW